MKQQLACLSLLLVSLHLGCATETELQGVQVDAVTLARQQSERHLTMDTRLQQLNDRVQKFGPMQEETRRSVSRLASTVDEVRIQLQRLQADIQETLRRAQRNAGSADPQSAAKMSEFDARLGELEKQLRTLAP